MRLAARLAVMGQSKYRGTTRKTGGRAKWNGRINLDESLLSLPKRWKAGRRIFVNSMSDLFHESIPLEFVQRVFHTMEETPRHTYQVLTKRAARAEELSGLLPWPRQIWLGVSVENADYRWRIDHLRRTPAAVKFLSLEPLIGPLHDLDLKGIHWVIVGGESGPGARLMQAEWVRSVRDRCERSGIAFHFKQWGGTNKKRAGRVLDGRTWDELPNSPGMQRAIRSNS
jgi:protein gp37